MKILHFLFIFALVSCKGIVHTDKITKKSHPELGTIGNYNNYLLQDLNRNKTVVELTSPIRILVEEVSIEEKELFKAKTSDKKSITQELVSITITDQIGLVQQLNSNQELLKYIKKGDNYRIVSEVTVDFSQEIRKRMAVADEFYLVQHKQKTLSIELRSNNKIIDTIEFSDGQIVSFTPSEFCWGLNRKRQVEIFDLVSVGANCSEDLYKTARKAKLKNEFKF